MRLEVMIGSSDPVIYPIKGSKVIIGSGEACDIVLPANSISRKHLIVTVENDNYFVSDQGSTNGSYINEERLIPGRKVEFTSFFPVRLGDEVLISLISDGDDTFDHPRLDISSPKIQLKSDHEATSVISLKQLKEVKTEKLIKRREEKRKKLVKKAPVKPVKKKTKIQPVTLVAYAIVALAAYYNFVVMKPEISEGEPPVEAVVTPPPVPKPVPPPSKLVDEEDLAPIESLQTLYQNIKCVTDVEKYLCQIFTKEPDDYWGVTQVGTMLYVMLDARPYIEEALKLVTYPENTEENLTPALEKHTKDVTALYFLMNAVPELDETILKDMKITFVFYKMEEVGPKLYSAVAIKPEALKEFKSKMKPQYLNSVRTPDSQIMTFSHKYYRVY